MLFKVTRNKLVRDNPELAQFPEFVNCSDVELKYVFLMYDYKSPYRQQPESIRTRMVLQWLGIESNKMASWVERHVVNNKVIYDKLMELQFDDNMELYLGYRAQMREWTELLKKKDKTDKESSAVFDLAKNMIDFIENMRKLEILIGERIKQKDTLRAKQQTTLERYLEEIDNEEET